MLKYFNLNYFRLFLLLLFVHQIMARNLECQFSGEEKFDNWELPPYRCVINNVSLKDPEWTAFTGDPIEKEKTTALDIINSDIRFIPNTIFKEFQQILGLLLRNCSIEILTRHDFDESFINLKYLQISNKLKSIEETSLNNLANLEWFNVENNNIEFVGNIFTKNRKLEYVNFRGNKITAISTKLFDNLVKLNIAKFEGNLCVSKDIVEAKTNKEWMTDLEKCFKKCMNINCDSSVENALRLTLARVQSNLEEDTIVHNDVIVMLQYVAIVMLVGLTITGFRRFSRRGGAHK